MTRHILQPASRLLSFVRRAAHILLAVGVLAFGAIQIGDIAAQFLVGGLTLHNLLSASGEVVSGLLSNAHGLLSGVFAVIMAIGLLLRSRLAWVVVVSLLLTNLIVWLVSRDGSLSLVLFDAALLVFLAWFRRSFDRISVAAASIFSFGSVALLMSYGLFGTYLLGAEFSPPIKDLETAFYFAIVTMSTVGYGDIHPVTPTARLYVVSLIVFGISVFATSLSTVLVPLLHNRLQSILGTRDKLMKHSGHYVIVGRSALAENTYRQLVARGQKAVFVTAMEPEDRVEGAQYVIGNPNDLNVLKQADCADALALLALGEDDANNAFVVLAAKELSKELKTVVAVNDARNLERVKRVEPDFVIAPTILGSELLAMAMTGEDTSSGELVGRLLQPGRNAKG